MVLTNSALITSLNSDKRLFCHALYVSHPRCTMCPFPVAKPQRSNLHVHSGFNHVERLMALLVHNQAHTQTNAYPSYVFTKSGTLHFCYLLCKPLLKEPPVRNMHYTACTRADLRALILQPKRNASAAIATAGLITQLSVISYFYARPVWQYTLRTMQASMKPATRTQPPFATAHEHKHLLTTGT